MQLRKRNRRARRLAAGAVAAFPVAGGGDTRAPAVVAPAIAAAACLLLGGEAAAGDGSWQVDSAVMYYGETGRVTAIEPVVDIKHDLADEESVDVKLVSDTLSGASHNGAPVRPWAQTFTSPSAGAGGAGGGEGEGGGGTGTGGYTVPAGAVPMDPNFHDQRSSVALTWEKPLADRLWHSTLGANYSQETDFISVGGSGTLARDFNKRNTTVTAGLSLENDLVTPTGGVHAPLSLMGSPTIAAQETRKVTDVLVGITQVLGRNTIAQVNYDVSRSNGYETDPYKVVANDAAGGPPGEFYYESRPGSRTKRALYGEIKHALGNGDVADAGYRYMTDDWGVVSHTVDVRYRKTLPAGWFLEPHARWYNQAAATFWVEALPAPPVPGTYASGDYRLGVLNDTTFGLRIGKRFEDGGEAGLRVESFRQAGPTLPAEMSALIVEFGYSFRW